MSRGRGRRRGLSEEDRALWDRVRASATPLRPDTEAGREPAPAPHPPEARAQAAPPAHAPLPEGLALRPRGRPAPPLAWSVSGERPEPVGRPEPGLDRRTADRLRRGERAPDARIDLHGMTTAGAHARLDAFMARAVRAGHRCILVITGKGGRAGSGEDAPFMAPDRGVLRQAAPRWLRSGPHAGRIVGIYEAHLRHGGAGAFYVYLKKGR